MATGVGFGFDLSFLKELEKADRRLDLLMQKSNKMSSAVTKDFMTMARNGVVPFVESLKQQKKILEEIGNVKHDGTNKMFSNLQRSAKNTVDEINKVLQALQKTKGYRSEASGRSAISFANKTLSARGDKSIDNLRKALAQLEAAQNRQNLNTKTGQKNYEKLAQSITHVKNEIDKVTGSTENLKKSHSKLLDTSGQLARALAAVFSVSAIKGYVNKLMQIRGEFELQQRSLQVLLQNKDEANALWDKTVSLAVKSPYTTKQLVTATKQLAAYRVESEKLYETNKMLADVSIGLGVDMNRLILAFGQVKAANFLRGTELRQFSEAGVNMLDELAKRFTMLEGRAVSVGEVFERVSKRMVSFADVEAVFKTITSEGGTFYQMQEKQSETLKGMMLNLKDSYELMLNDIGKSNEGVLKGFVSFMRVFVDGWREAAVVIKTAGTAMLFYFAASKIAKIGSAFSALWAAMAANPVGAIAAGVGVLIGLFVSLYQHTNKLNEALLEVEKNVGESLEESIGLYRKLTDTINDSTKSLDERNEAYENLKTKFKDILPDQQLELEYIQSLKFSYKDAEDAMFSYYNAKAIQQKKDKIESIYEGDFDRDTKDIVTKYKDIIENTKKLNEEQKVLLKSGVGGAVFKTLEKLKKGEINISDAYGAADAAAMAVEESIEEFLKDYSGIEINVINGIITKNAKQLARTAKKYTDAMLDVEGLSFETAAQKEAYNAMQEHNKEMENAVSLYKHLVSLRQKLADNKIDLTSDKSALNEKQLQDREWYLNDLNNTLNEIKKLSPDVANGIKEIDKSLVNAAEKGSYEFAKSLGVAENALYNIFADKAKTLKGGDEGASAMLTNFAEGIKANAESKLATPLQQAIISAFDLAIKERDIDQKGKDLLAKLLPDSKQTTEDVRKSVEALLKQYQDEVKKWENATAAGATKLPFVEYLNQFGKTEFKSAISQYLGSTEDFKNLEQKMIPVLEHIYNLLGGDPDKNGRSRDLVDERLRVIKEIYKAYKELNKTFDETTSKTGAMEKFGDAFYAAFGKTPEQMGYNLFTAEGVVDAYNKFISTLSKAEDITKGNLAKGEFVMELQVEMQQKNDKAFQEQIEQMFSGYELSLELEKLNIPRNVAERLFGVDTFDLSEIRDKIEKELYNLQIAGGGQDQINALQTYLKKVVDMENKAQQEIFRNYAKYLVQAQSERVKIKLDEIKQLREIESLNIGEEDKALMREGVKKNIQERLDSQAWKDFQDTGMYVRLFDNLETASMKSLDAMEDKLMQLRDSLTELSPSELKEINNQLEKIREIKLDKNPFKDLKEDAKDYFEYLKNKKDWEKNLKLSVEKEDALKERVDTEQLAIDADEKSLAITEKIYGENSLITKVLSENLEQRKANLQVLLNELEAQGKITKEQREQIENGENAVNSNSKRVEKFSQTILDVGSFIDDIASKWESAFGLDDHAKTGIDLATGIIGGVGQAGMGIAKAIANPADPSSWMAIASGIMSVVASIGEYNDAKLQNKIEAEAKSVERLQKVYEDLEEQIKNTYDISELNSTTKAAQDNLLAQISATERMIDAEEDKKKSDQDAIDGYKDEIDNLKKQYKELEETRLQELGAFATDENKKSGAEAFLDAWMEAYKQTGDGLSGLNEQFDEFFEDSVKRQMLQKATSKYLDNLFNKYDSAISDWAEGNLTGEELNEKLSGLKNDLPALNENLKKWAEATGIAAEFAGKDADLSGLQAGIQSVSEETADVLASYMSNVSLYVADNNSKITQITDSLLNGSFANPIVNELKTLIKQNDTLYDLLSSLTTPHPTLNGMGFKVVM